jgi:hypothetical protein
VHSVNSVHMVCTRCSQTGSLPVIAILSLVRIRFAGAQACKWMVPKWAQSYYRFRALTDEPGKDTFQ